MIHSLSLTQRQRACPPSTSGSSKLSLSGAVKGRRRGCVVSVDCGGQRRRCKSGSVFVSHISSLLHRLSMPNQEVKSLPGHDPSSSCKSRSSSSYYMRTSASVLAMATRPGTLKQLWWKWKMLDLPWRKQRLIGMRCDDRVLLCRTTKG